MKKTVARLLNYRKERFGAAKNRSVSKNETNCADVSKNETKYGQKVVKMHKRCERSVCKMVKKIRLIDNFLYNFYNSIKKSETRFKK